ncbi:unnamed protein product, partial [Laminaria digitata]
VVSTLLALLVATSTAAEAHHHHGASSDGEGPESYVRLALKAHPSIAAGRLRAEAMQDRSDPAGALMDPVLSFGIQNLPYSPFSFRATPMTGLRFGLSQRLPWPGKRGLLSEATDLDAKALMAGSAETANRLAASVRGVFYDIHFVDVAVDVINKNLRIIDGFVEVADAKYRVGRGLQQDVLKARVVRGQLEERRTDLQRRRTALAVRLNSLMATKTPIEIPSLLAVPVNSLDFETQEKLQERAEHARPQLRQLNLAVAAAEKRRAHADKAALPDFTVGLGYTFRTVDPARDAIDGADFLSLSAAVNLPVWYAQKQGPLASAAAKDVLALHRDREAVRLKISEAVQSILHQIPELLEQMEVYRTSIIPTTRQTLDADLIAYQVDKVDFLNLLDIEMRLLNFEVDYHRLHVEREKLIVRLAEAVGVSPVQLERTE